MTRSARRWKTALLSSLLSPLLATGLATQAQANTSNYPEQTIHIVVPYGPGGNTDVTTRLVAQSISESLNKPIVVDNRPGAGVTVGSAYVARAEPDGYTFLVTTLAHAINPLLNNDLPYDSDKDFEPVALIGKVPLILSVRTQSPIKSQNELIDMLRKGSSQYSYASSGVGSPMHIAGELFKSETNTDANHIPYKGESAAYTDVLGGHVDYCLGTITGTVPLVKAGSLRALSIASANRSDLLPDVPTMSEAGLPGFEAYTWTAVLAPAGTPQHIIDFMSREVNKALANPELQKRLTDQGTEIETSSTPQSTRDFIKAEADKWSGILKTPEAAKS